MNLLIALTVTGVLTLFGSVFKYRKVSLALSLIGLAVSLGIIAMSWGKSESFFNHMIVTDNYALAFNAVALLCGAIIFIFYNHFYSKTDAHLPEVFAIIIFSLAGAVVMFSYTNLIMLFLGVEILSLGFYILAGLDKRNLASNEAAMKYFLMGSFSTGFLLFGMALIYGASASFDLSIIATYVEGHQNALPGMFQAGVILVLVGLLFKVAAVPFHFWTPDVYQGAPTIITAYLATVGKIAGFGALYHLFHTCFISLEGIWGHIIWVVAVLTMSLGNIVAIYQTSIKRMLAYSSVAHAGYMLLAVLSPDVHSGSSLLFYSIGYSLASLSAFVIVHLVQTQRGDDSTESFKGLAKGNPLLGLVLAVAMLSLSGIPPTAGFFGKFYIFSAAVSAGYVGLVAIAVVNSFISVYYYFRPMIAGILQSSNHEPVKMEAIYLFVLVIIALASILLGVLPGLVSGLI